MKSFEIVTTFRYKGRIMKLFNIRKIMVLVSASIDEARISRTFFGGLKASRRWKLKKLIILENMKSNELSLVFSKIVSKGLCCDTVWGISIFSPIRGIYRRSLLTSSFLPPFLFLRQSSSQVVFLCVCPRKIPFVKNPNSSPISSLFLFSLMNDAIILGTPPILPQGKNDKQMACVR